MFALKTFISISAHFLMAVYLRRGYSHMRTLPVKFQTRRFIYIFPHSQQENQLIAA